MKKLLIVVVSLFFITGCSSSAKGAVEAYLSKYNNLDNSVILDVEDIVQNENLTDEQKSKYKEIFKKQYTNLTYKITNEEYDGDEAKITAKITVYDFYKAQDDAVKYLANNPDEFNDDNGIYDVNKYISYKLNKLKDTTDVVSYTIDFFVVKTENGWTVSGLSADDLEKIHGIYNYES